LARSVCFVPSLPSRVALDARARVRPSTLLFLKAGDDDDDDDEGPPPLDRSAGGEEDEEEDGDDDPGDPRSSRFDPPPPAPRPPRLRNNLAAVFDADGGDVPWSDAAYGDADALFDRGLLPRWCFFAEPPFELALDDGDAPEESALKTSLLIHPRKFPPPPPPPPPPLAAARLAMNRDMALPALCARLNGIS
jgi:hypothetical protein